MITLKPSTEPNDVQRAMIARKYGMFIHFGINTFYDTEWSNGKLDINGYRPAAIDAEGWVKNAYTKDPLVGAQFIADKYRLLTDHGNTLVVNVAPNTQGVQEKEDIDCLLSAARLLGIERSAE